MEYNINDGKEVVQTEQQLKDHNVAASSNNQSTNSSTSTIIEGTIGRSKQYQVMEYQIEAEQNDYGTQEYIRI